MNGLDILKINSIHLSYLTPLSKWKILDLKEMREEIDYPSHSTTFSRVIRRLEKAMVVKSFKDPYSKKKFVFLTEHGEKLVSSSSKSLSISDETMLHDAKVSQVSRMLLKRMYIESVLLEHEIGEKFKSQLPDALIQGRKKDVPFNIALELELTRKSRNRILDKVRKYINSSYYDYVLYLFPTENIYKSYKSHIEEEFGKEAFERVILIWNNSLLSKSLNLDWGKGYFKSKEVSFDDVL